MSTSSQLSLTTTPQLICSVDAGSVSLWVHATAITYFGGDDSVSSSTGFRLDANDKYQTIIPEGNEVWAVAASGTQKLYVFQTTI